MIIALNKLEDFDQLTKEGKVLIDFNASWCGPCQMLAPHLERLSQNYKDIKIISVNVDNYPELVSKYSISSIPLLIYQVNNEIKKKSLGYINYSQLERIIK